jgi:hypothetical protein
VVDFGKERRFVEDKGGKVFIVEGAFIIGISILPDVCFVALLLLVEELVLIFLLLVLSSLLCHHPWKMGI